MNIKFKRVDVDWILESCSEPFFSYNGEALLISFLGDLGSKVADEDKSKAIVELRVLNEDELPDEIYNSSGYRSIQLRFSRLFEFKWCPVSVEEKYSNFFPDTEDELLGSFYELIDGNDYGKNKKYLIIGNESFVEVVCESWETILKYTPSMEAVLK